MAIIDPRTKKKDQNGFVDDKVGTPTGPAAFNSQGQNFGSGLTPQNNARSSSGFTNIQSYKDANEGRAQGLVDATNQKVKEGFDTGIVDRVKNVANPQLADNSLNNINKINNQFDNQQFGDIDKEAFNSAINSSFQGPSSVNTIKEVGEAQTQIDKQINDAERLNNVDTRGTLIRDAFNEGTYTRGGGNLDSFLYNQGDHTEAKNLLDQANQQKENFTGFTTNYDEQIKTQREAIAEAAKALSSKYNTTIDSQIDELRAKGDTANQSNQDAIANYQAIVDALSTGEGVGGLVDLNRDGKFDDTDQAMYDRLNQHNLNWTAGMNSQNSLGRQTLGDLVTPEQKAAFENLLNLGDRDNPFNFAEGEAAGGIFKNDYMDKYNNLFGALGSFDEGNANFTKDLESDLNNYDVASAVLLGDDQLLRNLGYTDGEVNALNTQTSREVAENAIRQRNRKAKVEGDFSDYILGKEEADGLNEIIRQLGGFADFQGKKEELKTNLFGIDGISWNIDGGVLPNQGNDAFTAYERAVSKYRQDLRDYNQELREGSTPSGGRPVLSSYISKESRTASDDLLDSLGLTEATSSRINDRFDINRFSVDHARNEFLKGKHRANDPAAHDALINRLNNPALNQSVRDRNILQLLGLA